MDNPTKDELDSIAKSFDEFCRKHNLDDGTSGHLVGIFMKHYDFIMGRLCS